ncbi:MAG: hypothetical protein HY657_16945 [Acidobacteria bacterium]|nr:hypothetical protein [Acidobacteriota bacterium]
MAMETPPNLTELFHVGRISDTDLDYVFLDRFHSAASEEHDHVIYGQSKTDWSLQATYENDSLVEVTAGPALTTADIDAIVEAINTRLAVTGQRVGTTVLFAATHVRGRYRQGNAFQILPVPPGSPTTDIIGGDHPFVLEFAYTGVVDVGLNMCRRVQAVRELELFLAGILDGRIHSLAFAAKNRWVATSDPVGPLRIGYQAEMYTVPGGDVDKMEFVETKKIDRIAFVDSGQFFWEPWLRGDQTFVLPEVFPALFQVYKQLPPSDRQRLSRAFFWIQHAHRVYLYSRSAFFTGLITAIEALNDEPSGGATKRFIDFLEKYAPGAGDQKERRRRLYEIRSQLSHGGTLLRSDQRRDFLGFTPADSKEIRETSEASSLVRIAVVNWLISRSKLSS